jgi:hypothetical protein
MESLGLFLVICWWNKVLHMLLHFCFDHLQKNVISVANITREKILVTNIAREKILVANITREKKLMTNITREKY